MSSIRQRKTALRKITAREIKNTFGRFFAIFAIIALGVGFFAGLHATTPVLIKSVDTFYQDHRLYDYRLVSTIGWEESDVEKVRAREGVRTAEGALQYDVICETPEGGTVVYKVHSLTEAVNTVRIDEGRLPETASECLMDAENPMGLSVGDTITFSRENDDDTLDAFKEHTLTVTGFADAALYLNFERGTTSVGNGTVAGFLYLPKEAFTADYYTEIYVTLDTDEEILSDRYEELLDAQRDDWEDETEAIADDRYDRVKEDAEKELADAKDEFEEKKADGEQELKDAEEELADAKQELEDAEKELADAEEELADAKKELDDGAQELADAADELSDGKSELDSARKELADGYKELKKAEQKLTDSKKQLDEAAKTLDENAVVLKETSEKLTGAAAVLKENYDTLQAAQKQLSDANKTLQESHAQLTETKAQLDAASAELEEKEAQLDAAAAAGLVDADTLAAGRAEIAAGKGQIAAGYAAYEAGLTQYNEGLTEYTAQKAAYDHGLEAYNKGKEEYDAGLAQYNDGLEAYNAGLEQYEEGKKKYETGLAEYNAAKKQYEAGIASYENGLAEYNDGLAEYNDGFAEYEDGKKEYEDGLQEYADGRKEYEDGLAEYEDGLKEYEDGKKEYDEKIADAQLKIDDAEQEIADLKHPDTYLLERNTNIAYACFESDSKIVENVAVVFPFFFILVAMLVCMTTMTRMVEEQRGQIGTLKGLGYTDGDIIKGFMKYAGYAAVLGCLAGYAAGVYAFPTVIWEAYQMMYIPMQIRYVFEWKILLGTMFAALACSLGATYLSCRSALAESAASLMRPRAPKAGKRIFLEYIPAAWNRMKFMHKVSARNIFRYKKRFFMMVLGIGGCMALLLTGFGLKDSITGFAETQFDTIEVADLEAVFKNGEENTLPKEVTETLEETGTSYFPYEQSSWNLLTEGRVKSVEVIAPMGEGSLDPYFVLRTMQGEEAALPDPGEALISVSLSVRYGLDAGDTITLRNEDMKEMSLTVTDIFENHVYNYVFVSPEDVRAATGSCDANAAYANSRGDEDIYAVQAKLAKCEDTTNITVMRDLRNRLTNMLSSMNYVVLLIIVSAAGLAFIVLYNLTNINIIERIREIATIKVLGFYRRETSDYIFRENMVLTLFGAIVGIPLGILLHRFVMSKIVIDLVYFPVKISAGGYAASVLLTFGFTVFVNLVMSGKLEKIDMAESLKSVE